jgi:hypothetical protein
MPRAEEIENTNQRDRCSSPRLRMGKPEIVKCGQRADRRGDNVIGDQQEGADNRNDVRPMTHACVHAAAVGVMFADGDVIGADQRDEQAHAGDQPERAVSRDGECQANDVRFACAPVAVQDRRGSRCIHVAGSLGLAAYHRSSRARFRKQLTLAIRSISAQSVSI